MDGLLAVLIHPSCLACDRGLERPLDGPICSDCWSAIRRLTPPLCSWCGDALRTWRPAGAASVTCARCRRGPRHLDRARALGAYEGALQRLVQAHKYDGRRTVGARLGRLMRLELSEVLAGADAAVPVPLHPARRRARGFNQAMDLARQLGVPCVPLLRRVRHTPSQTGRSSASRRRNVRGAFRLRRWLPWQRGRPADWTAGTLVLVDDVVTTGATLEACAQVLKEAGAREVRAVTAARAVRAVRGQWP